MELETIQAAGEGEYLTKKVYALDGEVGIYRRVALQNTHPDVKLAWWEGSTIALVPARDVLDELEMAGVRVCVKMPQETLVPAPGVTPVTPGETLKSEGCAIIDTEVLVPAPTAPTAPTALSEKDVAGMVDWSLEEGTSDTPSGVPANDTIALSDQAGQATSPASSELFPEDKPVGKKQRRSKTEYLPNNL
jgi:hypothetical protein